MNSDRTDMALAHDKAEGLIRDKVADRLRGQDFDNPFGDESAKPVSQIVRDLALSGGGRALYFNHQIFWDVENLEDAKDQILLEVVTPEGWDEPLVDSDKMQVCGESKGHEYEILVELF